MPTNHPSIASIGPKPYLDSTADIHNGKDYAWLIDAMAKLKTGKTTKKEMAKVMGVTAPTLDKYIFMINLEKAQEHGRK